MVDPKSRAFTRLRAVRFPHVLGHVVPVAAETGWSDGDLEEHTDPQAGKSY
jgi:hypothetical protein